MADFNLDMDVEVYTTLTLKQAQTITALLISILDIGGSFSNANFKDYSPDKYN
nr:5081_t:CDS:2 [Entrophospora candida]